MRGLRLITIKEEMLDLVVIGMLVSPVPMPIHLASERVAIDRFTGGLLAEGRIQVEERKRS